MHIYRVFLDQADVFLKRESRVCLHPVVRHRLLGGQELWSGYQARVTVSIRTWN